MKILVISILRIGDVLMAGPVLMGLRKKYPKAQIDLVVNSECVKVKSLLPMINNVLEFERKYLQDGLVQAERPVLQAYDYLKCFVKKINAKKYDQIINLTQNKVSGYLCDLLEAPEKHGLIMTSQHRAQFTSQWFRFLNDISAAGAGSIFHYTDIFSRALSLSAAPVLLEASAASKNELEKLGEKCGPRIVFQILSSDEKKNISLALASEAIQALSKVLVNPEFVLLCAPSERPQIEPLKNELNEKAIDILILDVSLDAAVALFERSDVLVTTDTSIKHLAAFTKIKIIEIALGSSDPKRTGVYTENAIIVQSRESCVPCSHREGCHREKRFCIESITGYFLAALTGAVLNNNKKGLSILAEEYADQVEIYCTHFAPQGFWCAEALRTTAKPNVIEEWIDLSAWRFFLDKDHRHALAPYGSESMCVAQQIQSATVQWDSLSIRIALDQIEQKTEINSRKLDELQNRFVKEYKRGIRAEDKTDGIKDILSDLRKIEQEMDLGDALSARPFDAEDVGIQNIRILQSALSDISNQQQIKLKIVRTLKTQIMENS